jgi:cytochrome P450
MISKTKTMDDTTKPSGRSSRPVSQSSLDRGSAAIYSYATLTVVLIAVASWHLLKLQEEVDASQQSILTLIVALLSLWIAVYIYQLVSYEQETYRLHMPVIPAHLPVMIPYLGQAIAFLLRRPWDLLMMWHLEQYGPVFCFQLLGRTTVSLASPELIKLVLQSKISSVKKDIANTYHHFLVILGTGIVTSESTQWMQQRLKLSTALRQDVLTLIPKVTLLAIQRFMILLDHASEEMEKEVDLTEALRHLTLQVISGTFLSLDADESDSTFAEMYLPIVDESNIRVWHPYRPYCLFLPSWWIQHYNVYRLNTYVSKLIVQRWKERKVKQQEQQQKQEQNSTVAPTESNARRSSSVLLEGGDMLDHVLLAYEQQQQQTLRLKSEDVILTKDAIRQIRDEMKTFMLAGHETSAAMMTWALYELMDNESLREQVAKEGNAIFSPTINWKTASDLEIPLPEQIAQLVLAEACLKVRVSVVGGWVVIVGVCVCVLIVGVGVCPRG